MFNIRYGYLVTGIVTGLLLLLLFIWSLPDGNIHITFCDVGQGDGAYVKFPDGRDMLVDGGPNDKILECLGRHMPFWDRHINMVVMTHPQKDHMQGLISVLDRFTVDYFLRTEIENKTEGYTELMDIVRKRNISIKYISAGDKISVGPATMSLLWPTAPHIEQGKRILGAATGNEMNDYSMVFILTYRTFDTLFTGDADSRIQALMPYRVLADNPVELLKFPHHGSKTGITNEFLSLVSPEISVISVGKNSYGHPTQEALDQLNSAGSAVYRTDQGGDVTVVSDGVDWRVDK